MLAQIYINECLVISYGFLSVPNRNSSLAANQAKSAPTVAKRSMWEAFGEEEEPDAELSEGEPRYTISTPPKPRNRSSVSSKNKKYVNDSNNAIFRQVNMCNTSFAIYCTCLLEPTPKEDRLGMRMTHG